MHVYGIREDGWRDLQVGETNVAFTWMDWGMPEICEKKNWVKWPPLKDQCERMDSKRFCFSGWVYPQAASQSDIHRADWQYGSQHQLPFFGLYGTPPFDNSKLTKNWKYQSTIHLNTALFLGTRWRSGWGTALQTGRSRDRFPITSLEFFIHTILSAALWPWGRLSL
jgi:hypothetical protein